MNHRRVSLIVAVIVAAFSSLSFGVVSHLVPAGTAGNQAFGGALGMDFNTTHAIEITHLGVFDDGSDGLNRTITGKLWDRSTQTELASLTFTNANPGTLIDGSRFMQLAQPIILPRGFQGTIAAGGYGAGERNGNSGGAAPPWSTDDGGGLISFVGAGRFAGSGVATDFPTSTDGGPANRYAAGTFDFNAANIAYEVAAGATGNQNFGGSLGMDFDVNEAIQITELGVFDSGQDGLNRTITAHVYDRNDTAAPLATLVFGPGDDGELIGGSRFKDLATALSLDAGFEGTIVAEGYGVGELLANRGVGGFNGDAVTFDGGGLISFVGTSRFGTAGQFPNSPDGGPADRYLAGTFRFQANEVIPEPATGLLLLCGGAFAIRRRRLSA